MTKTSQVIDITGEKFNYLTAIKFLRIEKSRGSIWLFQCDCGKTRELLAGTVKNGHIKHCGCMRYQRGIEKSVPEKKYRYYQKAPTPEYKVWFGMKRRVGNYDSKSPKYSSIKICERWKGSFQNFLDDMGPRPGPGYSIDRIDNHGDYEPGNCRWATWTEQARNKSNNIKITFLGTTKLLVEWAEDYGLAPQCLYGRIERGWPESRLLEPSKSRRK